MNHIRRRSSVQKPPVIHINDVEADPLRNDEQIMLLSKIQITKENQQVYTYFKASFVIILTAILSALITVASLSYSPRQGISSTNAKTYHPILERHLPYVPNLVNGVSSAVAPVVTPIPSTISNIGTQKQADGTILSLLSANGNNSILYPLYKYPGENGKDWDPIYNLLSNASSTPFNLVINPDSGPGVDPSNDPNFALGIAKLRQYPNAKVIGYVPLGEGDRSLDDVYSDIDKYAGWKYKGQRVALDGIFFDESPSTHGKESYVQSVNIHAKSSSLPLTIQNIGTVPPSTGYFQYTQQTDISIIVEDFYYNYATVDKDNAKNGGKLGAGRSNMAYIWHGAKVTGDEMECAVYKMLGEVGHVYMSDLSQEDAYTHFSQKYQVPFVKVVDQILRGYVPSC